MPARRLATLLAVLAALVVLGSSGVSSGSVARSGDIAPGVRPIGLITSIDATFDGKATGSETNAAPVNGQQDLEHHSIDEQWHVSWVRGDAGGQAAIARVVFDAIRSSG